MLIKANVMKDGYIKEMVLETNNLGKTYEYILENCEELFFIWVPDRQFMIFPSADRGYKFVVNGSVYSNADTNISNINSALQHWGKKPNFVSRPVLDAHADLIDINSKVHHVTMPYNLSYEGMASCILRAMNETDKKFVVVNMYKMVIAFQYASCGHLENIEFNYCGQKVNDKTLTQESVKQAIKDVRKAGKRSGKLRIVKQGMLV